MNLRGKVVVISGASAGIGRALAVEVAKRGARVVAMMARRADALAAVAAEVEAAGAEALPLAADVARDEDVTRAVATVLERYGVVDVCVANAGIGDPLSAATPDQAALERFTQVNFLGAGRLIHACLPGMLARREGHIVGVSSLAGFRGMPLGGAYTGTKAALINLLESYRIELHLYGIQVSTVLPGFVDTELVAKNDMRPILKMTPTEAAALIARGIERDLAVIRFPLIIALGASLMRLVPPFIFDRVLRRAARHRLPTPSPRPRELPRGTSDAHPTEPG